MMKLILFTLISLFFGCASQPKADDPISQMTLIEIRDRLGTIENELTDFKNKPRLWKDLDLAELEDLGKQLSQCTTARGRAEQQVEVLLDRFRHMPAARKGKR